MKIAQKYVLLYTNIQDLARGRTHTVARWDSVAIWSGVNYDGDFRWKKTANQLSTMMIYDDYLQISNAIDDYINGYLLICKLINYHQHSSTIYLLCIYYDDLINYQSNVAIKCTIRFDHDQL